MKNKTFSLLVLALLVSACAGEPFENAPAPETCENPANPVPLVCNGGDDPERRDGCRDGECWETVWCNRAPEEDDYICSSPVPDCAPTGQMRSDSAAPGAQYFCTWNY